MDISDLLHYYVSSSRLLLYSTAVRNMTPLNLLPVTTGLYCTFVKAFFCVTFFLFHKDQTVIWGLHKRGVNLTFKICQTITLVCIIHMNEHYGLFCCWDLICNFLYSLVRGVGFQERGHGLNQVIGFAPLDMVVEAYRTLCSKEYKWVPTLAGKINHSAKHMEFHIIEWYKTSQPRLERIEKVLDGEIEN